MMSVVQNTRIREVVGNGSHSESGSRADGLAMLSSRDNMPGLAHTSTQVHIHSRREERGPSMFHGKRDGAGSVVTESEEGGFGRMLFLIYYYICIYMGCIRK